MFKVNTIDQAKVLPLYKYLVNKYKFDNDITLNINDKAAAAHITMFNLRNPLSLKHNLVLVIKREDVESKRLIHTVDLKRQINQPQTSILVWVDHLNGGTGLGFKKLSQVHKQSIRNNLNR